MAEIFLSYRRQDSQSATGRLADDLEARFGNDRVFRDHEIVAGDDFVEAIRRSVESSTVLLAVVGPRWLAASDAGGKRRLDDAADFVRLEIELALASRVAIVPVLVEGASMPSAAELPPSLAEFTRCQAVELSDKRWRYDVSTLIETLQARFAIGSDAAPLAAGGAARDSSWTRIATDVLDLALHPRRLIARKQSGRARDDAAAYAFLCAAILLGDLLLLMSVDIGVIARGSAAALVLGVAGWLFAGELVGLLAAGLVIATLALAWRISHRGAVFRRVALVAAYLFGGAWFGAFTGIMLGSIAVNLIDPAAVERVMASLHASLAGSAAVSLPPLDRLATAPLRGAASVFLVLAALTWLATAVWCIAAWGAFRQSLATTRLRSWLATSVWIALLAAIVWVPSRLV